MQATKKDSYEKRIPEMIKVLNEVLLKLSKSFSSKAPQTFPLMTTLTSDRQFNNDLVSKKAPCQLKRIQGLPDIDATLAEPI